MLSQVTLGTKRIKIENLNKNLVEYHRNLLLQTPETAAVSSSKTTFREGSAEVRTERNKTEKRC